MNPFEQAAAFFPFVNAEVFFEADGGAGVPEDASFDDDLDLELDAILARS